MGSLSVAYYTIAPISLDLLRPALLSETKNTRCGETGEERSRNLRLKRPLHYRLCYSPRSFIWLYGPETSKRTDTILAASSQQ